MIKKFVLPLLLLALPIQAFALTAKDLLSLVAMPLAVAAVADVAHVPQDQLASLVTSLNGANVPPTDFVNVLRYTPAALVVQNPNTTQPTLVQYVNTQTSQGVTGDALVAAIEQQLQNNYGVTPVVMTVPATELVVQPDYIPSNVLAQLGGTTDTTNPLSLIAMPLAVAAVSDLTGVPQDQLAQLALMLNQANVPPAQFVEVLRYVPVALVTTAPQQPPFVQYVQTQLAQGVTGTALVTNIQQQLPNYGVPQSQITVNAPALQPVYNNPNYFPPVVRERVAQAESNPHGGPPGQLKKIEGLQTGAEVVHGMKPGREFGVAPPVVAEQRPNGNPHMGRGEGGRGHGNPHGMPPGEAKKYEQLPPMTSGAPAPAAHVPPGQAKKMGGAPVVNASPQPPPPVAMPPGREKGREQGGPPAGGPPGQQKKGDEGHGHGHGND